jgi:xanthine dehydrogenase YagT iron-sulfur-binding subunit
MTGQGFDNPSSANLPEAAGCCGEAHAALARRDLLHLAAAVPLATMPLGASTATANTMEPAVPTSRVQLTVNGEPRALEIDNRTSLLDILRETLDLTGAKKGCNQGACGACTVLLNGKRVVSCLTLAAMQDGARVETIEGLAQGERLHPLQTAFIEHEGLQCGFCTSGQIMSGIGCIAEGHARSPEEIRFWMSGNICRCGAYPGIIAAISDAAGRV